MDPRRIAVVIIFCVAVVPQLAVRGQELQPIADRSRRIEIPGVSVSPPQGDHWFLFPLSPRETTPTNSLIRFVYRFQNVARVRPEDARQVFAGVVVTDSGEAKARTPAEFLQAFRGDFGSLVGEMITRRQRLTQFDAVLDDSVGGTCVRYTRLTEITGQFPAFPDLVAISSTRGLYCSHPYWPQYHIDLTYQQNYPKGQRPLARGAEADVFLKSMLFTAVRPVAAAGPKALYVSHMQAADTAYRQQRWPEAEVSFRAALKAAEYLGPENALAAISLYYLASTEDKLGRPADAEPLLRRALNIFDAQSHADNLEVAHVHGLTLNDLAVILAIRASSVTPPSSQQRQLQEAERLLQRALAMREKSDPAEVGRTLSNLTQVYMDSGRWSEAAGAAQRAVSFYERRSGPESEESVYQLDRLADIYLQQDRLAEAETIIERVVSGMRKTHGPNYPGIARRLESYALALRKAGRDEDASKVEARARRIRGNDPAQGR
jgi:tetratricopeptide (TPR) repeat protein